MDGITFYDPSQDGRRAFHSGIPFLSVYENGTFWFSALAVRQLKLENQRFDVGFNGQSPYTRIYLRLSDTGAFSLGKSKTTFHCRGLSERLRAGNEELSFKNLKYIVDPDPIDVNTYVARIKLSNK